MMNKRLVTCLITLLALSMQVGAYIIDRPNNKCYLNYEKEQKAAFGAKEVIYQPNYVVPVFYWSWNQQKWLETMSDQCEYKNCITDRNTCAPTYYCEKLRHTPLDSRWLRRLLLGLAAMCLCTCFRVFCVCGKEDHDDSH